MNRQLKHTFASCLTLALVAQITAPAQAFPPPAGAVAGVQKLQKGMGDGKDDITFSPILLEMAKLIGRTGLTPGFFLQDDSSFPDEPGVDLRTLLLWQAGLIKMPVRIITGKRQAQPKPEEVPTLAVPPIPEPRNELSAKPLTDLPSLASQPLPHESEGTQVVPQKANVGQPEKISFRNQQQTNNPSPEPLLSLDVARFKADMINATDNDPNTLKVRAEMPRLAMAMPRPNSMPFITNNSFRLWTYRPSAKGERAPFVAHSPIDPNFNGTFVVATTGAIKSITGRHFTLANGRLLANNRGGELLLQTALADISLDPDATAVVDVLTQGPNTVVKIFALESNGGRIAITVPNAKEKTLHLNAGETVTVSQGQPHAIVARSNFSIPQFVEKELMLKSDAAGNTERYATLTSLKRKLESH